MIYLRQEINKRNGVVKMTNEIKTIERKINELAKVVVPYEHLESFNRIPLKERIFGIKFFATMANDLEVIKMCEYAEKVC
jgi:hypothetical protein